jgi:UDP-N-acetylmuramyl pentapeptide phosphotransferase/UDP-N-acetylglucosamine-1-phosphate transferase
MGSVIRKYFWLVHTSIVHPQSIYQIWNDMENNKVRKRFFPTVGGMAVFCALHRTTVFYFTTMEKVSQSEIDILLYTLVQEIAYTYFSLC